MSTQAEKSAAESEELVERSEGSGEELFVFAQVNVVWVSTGAVSAVSAGCVGQFHFVDGLAVYAEKIGDGVQFCGCVGGYTDFEPPGFRTADRVRGFSGDVDPRGAVIPLTSAETAPDWR